MRRFSGIVGVFLFACSSAGTNGEDWGDGEPQANGSTGGASSATGGADGTGGMNSGGSLAEPMTGGGGGESTGGASSGGGASTGGTLSTGGSGSGGEGTGGEGTGGGGDGCPFSGNVTYQLNNPETWPENVVQLITEAMDGATFYYNCYADLTKSITVNYNAGVPTAQANIDGWLSFGASTSYMQVATAMHEVAHTLGVGYSPWAELLDEGRFTGAAVNELMQNIPAEERDADDYSQRTYITGDSQHFWPYGLNQAAENKSEWSLINHVRIVAAIQVDKQTYLDGD